jgi:AcrR family transcriptional regulator
MVTQSPKLQFHRDATETRARIIAAVGRIIIRDGLTAMGVNALAREAGCDKVLIYRYFGDLEGVYQAFASQGDFWWTLDELCAGIEPRKMPLAEAVKLLLRRHALALRGRPMTLAVLAAELVNRTRLVVALERVRERRSLELNDWLARNYALPHSVDFECIALLLGAAINYLAARARSIKVMSGIPIKSDADWERLMGTIDAIVDCLIVR